MREVYEFLKNCGVYYLATVEGDQPRVRPFGTIEIFENKLYIQTGRKKDVAKQLYANPKAEIVSCKGIEWLRITCKLIENDDRNIRVKMLEKMPSLRAMYNEDDGNMTMFEIKDAKAIFSSFVAIVDSSADFSDNS